MAEVSSCEEQLLKKVQPVRELGWGKFSENNQGGVRTVLARLMETWIGCLPVLTGYVGEGSTKEPWCLLARLVSESTVPPALFLRPDNLVFPHMTLALFELVYLLWILA